MSVGENLNSSQLKSFSINGLFKNSALNLFSKVTGEILTQFDCCPPAPALGRQLINNT